VNRPFERLSAGYRERIRHELLADPPSDPEALRDVADRRLRDIIRCDRVALSAADVDLLVASVIDDTLGFGPLDSLLTDPAVTEVIVNGCDAVFAERGGKLVREPVRFRDDAHLRDVIDRIVGAVGRRVDESSPMVDARLGDGSRVNAVLPPLAVDGPLLTIRRFPDRQLTLDRLVALGSLDPGLAELLRRAVTSRLNIAVCGGTGSGKTTFLNALAACIDSRERIVTVEDAAELRLPLPHVARLESRPPNLEGRGEVPLRALVRNALRMRPDRIIVGEVRGAEALDMLQAMNTGHDGSLTTVHAGSPDQALRRIEMMVLMAGLELPHAAVHEHVRTAIDVIVHVARDGAGRRYVVGAAGCDRVDGGTVALDSRLLAVLEEGRCPPG
jgi:pilus assembly protein CpaF